MNISKFKKNIYVRIRSSDFAIVCFVLLCVLIVFSQYFKTLNNRPWGANNESLGGPGGPGTGFCSPGGGFLVLVDVVACHYVYYH